MVVYSKYTTFAPKIVLVLGCCSRGAAENIPVEPEQIMLLREMKKHIFWCTLFACVAGAGALYAQTAQDSVKTQDFQLDEVQIVASVPVFRTHAVELEKQEITRSNVGQNLPVFLASTPALVTTSDDGLGIGYTYFHIRGTDQSRINVTINGVPVNDAESQTVFWVNVSDIAAGTESLTVQRGVGTSTNGSSAFGASINLSMLPSHVDSLPFAAGLDFTGGMYRTFRESAFFRASKGAWNFGGRFSKINSDGYVERAKSDLYSYQANLGWHNARTKVDVLGFGGIEHTYMAWYGISDSLVQVHRRYNPAGLLGDTVSYDNQTDNFSQHHAQLHIRHSFSPSWSLSAAGHYTYGTGYYEMADYATYSPENGWDGITRDGLTTHMGGANINGRYLNDYLSLQFGLAAQYYTCDHWGRCNSAPTYRGAGDKTDGNVYAKLTGYPLRRGHERLSLYGDLQYRLVDYRISGDNEYTYEPIAFHHTYHFFNPKAGLEYLNHGHQLTASFAMANRESARSDFLNASEGDWPKPERLYDYELGYTYTFRSSRPSGINGSVGLNLYCMDYDNQLVSTGALSALSYAVLTNVRRSYRCGVEAMFGIDWTDWFRWEGNLVWSRNKWRRNDGSWNTISFSPDWTAANVLDFHIAGFQGVLTTNVVSSQYLDNDQSASLKAYTFTNLQLNYTLPIRRWMAANTSGAVNKSVPSVTLRCLLNNLFDARYCSNGNTTYGTPLYYPQAGINVHAGFAIRW